MGTKVQHKMYLSGYYPMRDLNDSTGGSSWPSHHENKTFGQHYGIFSPWPAIDGYLGYDKEQLRQTILKHEMVFRKQLHELHRLYKIQADMMNEVRSKEPHKYLKPNGTSQSRFFAFPSVEDKNRRAGSSLPLVDLSSHIPSASGADSIQSHYTSMNLKIMESGCGSIYSGSRSKEYDFLESKCKKLQRRLFDLELPPDECINDEEEGQGASGGSGVGSCLLNRNSEKNGNLSPQSGAYSICNGDASSSSMTLKRNLGFTDLNEPVQVDEASGTASVDILGNITCSREHMQRRDLYASSCSGFLAKEKDGVSLSNLHLENGERQKGLAYTFNPEIDLVPLSGQTTNNRSSQNGGLHCEYLPAICESSQVGCQKAQESDQHRKEQSTRKTIFGVEICERNRDASGIASDTSKLQPLIPQCSVANSESSSISSWKTHPASWRQSLTSVQGNYSFNTCIKSDNGSGTFNHDHEVAWDRSIANSHVRSISSLKAEQSHQNNLCVVSQLESKESHVLQGSLVSFSGSNGISDSNSASEQVPQHSPAVNFRSSGWFGNLKSVDKANAVLPKSSQNEAIFHSKQILVDDPKKEENLKGGLPWLGDISLCNGKYSNEMNGSDQANLDFLQNHSRQNAVKAEVTKSPSQTLIQDSSSMKNSHVHDVEDRRMEGGDCSRNMKILGVAISEKQLPKELSSATSASKPSVIGVNGVNSVKARLLLADLNQDPTPPEYVELQHLKSQVAEEGSVDCTPKLRDCIDLNVTVTEEEAQSKPFSSTPKVKIALDIDLEAPVVLDTDIDITSGGEFVESKLKESIDLSRDELGEGFMRLAAEALIAISSSVMPKSQHDATDPHLEASFSDSLNWFADIITSCEVEIENDVQSISVGKDNTDCEDSVPHGIDYFEYMTLNLTETKLEEYHYEPCITKGAKEEVTLPRRTRRGQARRGRQRKDFQRDILPSLASLSRNDVTEDIQTIEGLIRATGGIWQSSLSQRNSPRCKRRGRKRSMSSPSSPAIDTVSLPQPQPQQPKCGELGFEETKLTGWGKRTRRPQRQRCPTNHPSFPVQ